MSRAKITRLVALLTVLAVAGSLVIINPSQAISPISIFIDGVQLKTDATYGQPVVINNRTMVPLRAISEGLGMEVGWDQINNRVIITTPAGGPGNTSSGPTITDYNIPIMGEPVATSAELRALQVENNPNAPDVADLYLQIGREYGIRGDIAFCQAAKETGWWKFSGLVQPQQNNYCGLYATGSPATGEESLNGADSNRVTLITGMHGAFFDTPATGVEAHIQHLYAYVCDRPLPPGKTLVDPRFNLLTQVGKRNTARYWPDLNGQWAVPGIGYGESILNDYYFKVLPKNTNSLPVSLEDKVKQLEKQNELLRIENQRLKSGALR